MNAANKPHAPDPIKIRGILADTELSASARLAAVELYYHTDWMTGELICRDTIAAHIRRTIGVKMSASKTILKQLRESGYIDGVFFRPVVGGRKTGRPENRPVGKPASRKTDRSENRPPPVGKPTPILPLLPTLFLLLPQSRVDQTRARRALRRERESRALVRGKRTRSADDESSTTRKSAPSSTPTRRER